MYVCDSITTRIVCSDVNTRGPNDGYEKEKFFVAMRVISEIHVVLFVFPLF